MPKYWGKQIFTHGSFPEVGQNQKTERKRKKERIAKVGNNNDRLCSANATSCGARKAAWANIKLIFLYFNRFCYNWKYECETQNL